MLFFAFLGINFSLEQFSKTHLRLMVANLVIPAVLFFSLLPFGDKHALVGFVLGIAPCAAASPVLAQFMRTDIAFVTTSVILTNPLSAICIPLVLPLILIVEKHIHILDVLLPVVMVVGLPLLLSSIVKNTSKPLTKYLLGFKQISFYLFLINVWIGCGKASYFIQHQHSSSWGIFVKIAAITGVISLINFKVGEFLVDKKIKMAGGLSLGRKNTMFALWVALTFIDPIVAMGPIFYIIFQNSYNTWQIMQVERNLNRQHA